MRRIDNFCCFVWTLGEVRQNVGKRSWGCITELVENSEQGWTAYTFCDMSYIDRCDAFGLWKLAKLGAFAHKVLRRGQQIS